MWLAYQVSLDCPLQIRNTESQQRAQKWVRKTRKPFLLFHCSSCRLNGCMDVFEGIFSTCRCEFETSYPPEDAVQEEEEEEMATSQVIVLSRVWGCVCFSSWHAWTENLQNFSSLLLSFLPGVLVITFLFFTGFCLFVCFVLFCLFF